MGHGITIFLNTRGDDTCSGTKEKPLATFGGAWIKAREAARIQPVTVRVSEGTYYLKETLVLDRSGGDGDPLYPILFEAVPGAKPVISGSEKLDLSWKKHSDKIFRADLPLSSREGIFDQLFVNGRRQILARYPSGNPLSPLLGNFSFIEGADERVFPEGKGSAVTPPLPHREVYYNDDRFSRKKWSRPEEAVLHIFPRENWDCLQFRVRGIDYENRTVLLGEGGFQQHERFARRPGTDLDSTSRFYIENVFEELDSPGEWYYDRVRGELYYYPPEGVNPDTARFEVPRLRELIRFRGESGDPCRSIHMRGLRFTGTVRTFFDNYEVPSFGDWKIVRSGALYFENSRDCSLEDCFIDAPGGNGIFLNNLNKRVTVKNCLITECGESGLALVGRSMLTRGGEGYDCPHCGKHHPWNFTGPTREYSSDCLIENNLIHDIGVWGKQTAALFMAVSKGNKIRHNEFYNIPRAALCIHDGTYGGHVIEHNFMHHTCRETDEHGTFNSWGRDSWWCLSQSHEGVSHGAGNVLKDARETVVLRNNRFLDFKGWGIDLDDGSSNYDIYNNVCIGVGIKNREGDYRKVHNNIVYLPTITKPTAIQVGCEDNSDAWYNNIIYAEQDPIHLTIPPKKGRPVKICDGNLYYSRQGYFSSRGRDFDRWKELGLDEHSLFGDPLFSDGDKGDFTVNESSPALELGFENFPQNEYGLKDFPGTWRDLEPEYPVYDYDTMNREMLKNIRGTTRPVIPDIAGSYTLDEELGRTQSPRKFVWNLKYVNGGVFRVIYNYRSECSRSCVITSFVESIGSNTSTGELSESRNTARLEKGRLSLSGEETDVIRITLEIGGDEKGFKLSHLELSPE